jgi:Ca-activated chloride channel family protein
MNVFRIAKLFCFSFVALFVFAAVSQAQGVIVPRPCPVIRCPRPPRPAPPLPSALPIKSIKFETKISGQIATTHVEQIFRNDTDATLEGTYFFPIPETAAISEFAIWDGTRRLVGEVRSREEARRIYDEIVRRQRDPGLLEYAGKNLFQASIFPIPPRSDKKLELTYTQTLAAEARTVGYRYPLGTGRNLQAIGSISGRVEIEAREPVRNIYSPSHRIDIARVGERRASLSFEAGEGKTRAAGDFQLFYALSDDDFGFTLMTHREPGKDGYFMLLLSPKEQGSATERLAKDVVFVIDTSGSMAEEGKMTKARAALLFGLRTLAAQDRFNVVAFAGEERLMSSSLIQADEAGRARGIRFVESLQPVGGTNINAALVAAHRQFANADRLQMIVYLTDGLPTVGETNAERIIENSKQARAPGVRLFTFGVGYDVNTLLLDKLAAEGRGTADYVEPKEDLEVKVSNFFTKISYPVLSDLELETGATETDLLYPRALPDVFRGTQLVLIGRYRNSSSLENATWRLNGRVGNRRREFAYTKLRFPREDERHDFLPRLWATRRVGWLMEQIRSNGEARELRDEIVDLGTRYGIVTPYTSYLALEPDEERKAFARQSPDSRQMNRRDVAPTKSRRDSGAMMRNDNAPSAAPMVGATTGAGAVALSKQAREQQDEVIVVESENKESVRNVRGKTFYLREGVWTDADYKADARLPETSVQFASEEYFALVRRAPALSEFFALGQKVVVVFDGRVYRVTAAP